LRSLKTSLPARARPGSFLHFPHVQLLVWISGRNE
jgi:hypothetical protein